MPTPPTPMQPLASLIGADPELPARLHQAGSIEQCVQIALSCARQHGLNVEEAGLLADFSAHPDLTRHLGAGRELTDKELAGAAGGGTIIPDLNGPGTFRGNQSRAG